MKTQGRIRLLCLLLCLMVLLPCVPALSETTKVSGYLLRLREEASEDGKVRVKGNEGYMMTCYLAYSKDKPEEEKSGDSSRKSSSKASSSSSSKSSSSGSSSSASSKANKKEKSSSSGSIMYIEKGVCLNLREEANGNSTIIDSYRGGTKVTVLKKGKYWSKVEINGTQGYVATDFLTSEK